MNCEKSWITPIHLDGDLLAVRKCPECKKVALKRVYGDFFVEQKDDSVGQITREAIEEAKKDLKQQKKDTKKEIKT